MGMESYFIKLRLKEENFSNESTFVQKLVKNGINIKAEKDNYIIEDTFVLRFELERGYLNEMSFEGCLSWFEKGLGECFELFQIIHNKIVEIQIIQPDNISLPMSKEIFIDSLMKFYKDKFERFFSTYGNIEVKILPNKPFYDYIEKTRKKSILNKIFRK